MHIIWLNRETGQVGRGWREMSGAEARKLARELNRDYPRFKHQVSDGRTRTVTSDPEPAKVIEVSMWGYGLPEKERDTSLNALLNRYGGRQCMEEQ